MFAQSTNRAQAEAAGRTKPSPHRSNNMGEVLRQQGKSPACLRNWEKGGRMRAEVHGPGFPNGPGRQVGDPTLQIMSKSHLLAVALLLKTRFTTCLSFHLQNGDNNMFFPSQYC